MNKNIVPYLLPVVTLFGLILFAFLNPSITGFATGNQQESKDVINATIKIFTSDGIVLPGNTTVTVFLDDKNASMSVERFIKQSGGQYEYKQGKLPGITYVGYGYTGNYNYFLDLSYFGLGLSQSRSTHSLKIVVSYGDKVISESLQQIKKS